jgi:hypothetical protein
MALYGNQKDGVRRRDGSWVDEGKLVEVAPAKLDEMLMEALDALERTRRLHETTPNPETKRQTKCILNSLHSSLLKLAPLGIHSAQRLERVPLSS